MDVKYLSKFRELLIENKISVSELEYIDNNYNDDGNLIKESLPTLTTDFCEIGFCKDDIYFVVIMDSKTFNIELFNKIKDKPDVKIYGLIDFKNTLYPVKNFNPYDFFEQINKDKYLQVQFNFKNINDMELLKEYFRFVDIFEKNKAAVINQLEADLTKRN